MRSVSCSPSEILDSWPRRRNRVRRKPRTARLAPCLEQQRRLGTLQCPALGLLLHRVTHVRSPLGTGVGTHTDWISMYLLFSTLLWLGNALKESRHETYCLGDQLTTQIVPFFICSSIPTTLENKGEITYTRPREIVFHTIQMEIQLETDYLLIRKRSQ